MTLGISAIDPSMMKPLALEQQLRNTAQIVGQHLDDIYPGYPWYVRCDGARFGGSVLISIPRLTGNFRYEIPFRELYSDPMLTLVTRGGGEILERFGLNRGRRDFAQWLEVLRKNPKPAEPVTVRRLDGSTTKVMPDAVK